MVCSPYIFAEDETVPLLRLRAAVEVLFRCAGFRFADDDVSRNELIFPFAQTRAETVNAVLVYGRRRAVDGFAEVSGGDGDFPRVVVKIGFRYGNTA